MTIQPAIRSFVSANGPSVTGGRPSPSERTQKPSGDSACAVDELAGALEPGGEVAHELDVGVDLVRRPLVHRDVVDGRRGASVVLEEQVLRHGVLLV